MSSIAMLMNLAPIWSTESQNFIDRIDPWKHFNLKGNVFTENIIHWKIVSEGRKENSDQIFQSRLECVERGWLKNGRQQLQTLTNGFEKYKLRIRSNGRTGRPRILTNEDHLLRTCDCSGLFPVAKRISFPLWKLSYSSGRMSLPAEIENWIFWLLELFFAFSLFKHTQTHTHTHIHTHTLKHTHIHT